MKANLPWARTSTHHTPSDIHTPETPPGCRHAHTLNTHTCAQSPGTQCGAHVTGPLNTRCYSTKALEGSCRQLVTAVHCAAQVENTQAGQVQWWLLLLGCAAHAATCTSIWHAASAALCNCISPGTTNHGWTASWITNSATAKYTVSQTSIVLYSDKH